MTRQSRTHGIVRNTLSLLLAFVIALSPAAAAASELSVAAEGSSAESTAEQQAAIISPVEPATESSGEDNQILEESEPLQAPASEETETTANNSAEIEAEASVIPSGGTEAETEAHVLSDDDSTTQTALPLEKEPDEDSADSIDTGISVEQETDISSISGSISAQNTRKIGDVSTSGAVATSNTLNMIQSDMSLAEDEGLVTFTKDIQGDVKGDILIDPNALGDIGGTDKQTHLDVNTTTNQHLNNTVGVSSKSGDIALENNRTVGDVSTGNADAVANVVNLINSAVSSGKSFFGIINILGNLDGDILLPEDFIDGLLGVSGQTDTTPASGSYVINPTNREGDSQVFSNTLSIDNDVSLNAMSGSVSADNVRRIGDVSTGNAETNLTIYNLAGTQVVGKNTLLVFVNVLGTWTGFIIDAPTGATSAALGGLTTTSPYGGASSGNVNSTTTSAIANSVSVSAQSGDVALSNGRKVGDVSTGNATASANILNIVQSQLSLAEWFGILFINVFGTWNGSFGVNTTAGDPPAFVTTQPTNTSTHPALISFDSVDPENRGPVSMSSRSFATRSYVVTSNDSPSDEAIGSAVLASTFSEVDSAGGKVMSAAEPSDGSTNYTWVLLVVGGSVFALVGYRLFITRGTI